MKHDSTRKSFFKGIIRHGNVSESSKFCVIMFLVGICIAMGFFLLRNNSSFCWEIKYLVLLFHQFPHKSTIKRAHISTQKLLLMLKIISNDFFQPIDAFYNIFAFFSYHQFYCDFPWGSNLDKFQFFTQKTKLFNKVNISIKWPQKINPLPENVYLSIYYKMVALFAKNVNFFSCIFLKISWEANSCF